jgi:hypothetical protein
MDTDLPVVRPRLRRAREWLARYGPAEVAAILGAVLAAGAADRFGLPAATAFAGAIGETVAFYAVIVARDLRARPPGVGRRGTALILRGLVVEFGPAELLDTFALRPLAMYLGPLALGNMTGGVIAGKIAADVAFYTLAVIGYEVRKSLPAAPPVPATMTAVPPASRRS